MYTCVAVRSMPASWIRRKEYAKESVPCARRRWWRKRERNIKSRRSTAFFVTSSVLEHDGYCQWPRLKETVVFASGWASKRIGLAFCIGLAKEAKVVADL